MYENTLKSRSCPFTAYIAYYYNMSATTATAATATAATATASTATATAPTKYSLVYRGNAIDGWISAFIAYTAVKGQGQGSVQFYAIPSGREVTSKQVASWAGSHVLFLDLSFSAESEKKILEGSALSVETIDYRTKEATMCSARLAWHKWYAHLAVPFWLSAVDRISRWDQPTFEDRCMREVLANVAHMPPKDALTATDALMTWMTQPLCTEFQSLMTQGHAKLEKKDEQLMATLGQLGTVYDIREEDTVTWGLTPEWAGLRVFLLENSDLVIDTNEAAFIVFGHFADVSAFINYRKKVRRDPKTGTLSLAYLYSARSHGFDLTTGDFFKGQKQSAGAQHLIHLQEAVPFVPVLAVPVPM